MRNKLNRKQLVVVIMIPVGVACVTLALYHFAGMIAFLFGMTMLVIFLAYLIIELRHYVQLLFVRKTLEDRAMFSQIEALIGINRTLDPILPLPSTRGWSASPDLLREIVEQVLTRHPMLVVEASSGTSTLVIGYCLKKLGKGKVIALEHDPKYVGRTERAIKAHGLEDHASVVYAPLVDHDIKGQRLIWYDHAKAILNGPIDLLIVDGPPDTTTALARFPAVPILREKFNRQAAVFLDDGDRDDERITAEKWHREFGAHSLEYIPLEKGAWLLLFDRTK